MGVCEKKRVEEGEWEKKEKRELVRGQEVKVKEGEPEQQDQWC